MARVSQRLGLSKHQKGDRIERDLMKLVPQQAWTFWGPAMVLHGRYTCKAKAPACTSCMFSDLCPRHGIDISAEAKNQDSSSQQRSKKKQMEKKTSVPHTGGNGQATERLAIPGWQEALAEEMKQPYFQELREFVVRERREHEVFPPEEEVYTAFALTPLEQVKVLILGQDPYHDDGQAHGLSFSVKRGVKLPPSLRNIFKELHNDLGIPPAKHGDLSHCARQGVMMLNAVLTVRAHKANSHKDRGWERFTDAVIDTISKERSDVVFVLWGRYAQKKAKLIDKNKHLILSSAHPSPLSAKNGFFGSKPFSKINEALREARQAEIDWALPE